MISPEFVYFLFFIAVIMIGAVVIWRKGLFRPTSSRFPVIVNDTNFNILNDTRRKAIQDMIHQNRNNIDRPIDKLAK